MWPVLPVDYAANGLGTIERAMVDEPDEEHYVVALVNRRRATIDDDSGETTPIMRVLRIEPCLDDFAGLARQLLNDTAMKRTNAGTLFEDPPPGGEIDGE